MAAAEPVGSTGEGMGGGSGGPEGGPERTNGYAGCRQGVGAGTQAGWSSRSIRGQEVGQGCLMAFQLGLRRMESRPQATDVPYRELCWAAGPRPIAPPGRAFPGAEGNQRSSYCLPTGWCRPSHCCWVALEGCGHRLGVRGECPGTQERPQVSPAYLVRPLCWGLWPANIPSATILAPALLSHLAQ